MPATNIADELKTAIRHALADPMLVSTSDILMFVSGWIESRDKDLSNLLQDVAHRGDGK